MRIFEIHGLYAFILGAFYGRTGLAVISIIRLYDFNISASWNS